ncbi:uncharacterized protein HD556DRAFT_1308477 [Suillus plorans]|uniref:Uncharacterized protein n=1 Tax=Suillus plorans TaxID=116603 RepID=A0A9P7APH6_9AGAM|nr:uncharacterized protein HD556DRAFT_1308477 [Suillus plorans]KAG1793616.1 hypothetical protein HD556DRAFT_1308477 [Suillus plorans]
MAASMSEDDVAYTALLRQLLSDNSTTRNARVHSWIEHQYDFALSESDTQVNEDDSASLGCSRAPSPSPSSSLGAHRTFCSDRPDSPLLPRSSTLAEDEAREERERERALRFLVQEMSHWKMQSGSTPPRKNMDKLKFVHLALTLSTTTLASDVHNAVHFVACHAFAFLINAHLTTAFIHKHVVI